MEPTPRSRYAIPPAELERGVAVPAEMQVLSVAMPAGGRFAGPGAWGEMGWWVGGLGVGSLGWALAADDGD